MDEEEIQKPEPKVSDVEAILIGVFFVALDIIDFIPVAGDITDIIAAPMGFYYWNKGLKGTTFLVSEAIEAIPGAQEFPFIRIICWGITVWLDRHPKIEGTLSTALQVAEVLEGNVEGGEASAVGGSGGLASAGARAEGATLDGGGITMGTDVETPEGSGTRSGNSRPSEENNEKPSERKTDDDRTRERRRFNQEADDQEGIGGEPGETEKERRARESQKDYAEDTSTGNTPDTIAGLEDNYFSPEGPRMQDVRQPEDAIPKPPKDYKGLSLVNKKAQEVKEQFTKPKTPQQIQPDEDSNYLEEKKAA